MRNMVVFQSPEELVRAFSKSPRNYGDNFPVIPDDVCIKVSDDSYISFHGPGAERFKVEDFHWQDVLDYLVDQSDIRIG